MMGLPSKVYFYGYQALTCLCSLLVWPLFFCHPRGRRRLAERYGKWDLPVGSYLWFHGASVGEINGLLPLIKAIRPHTEGKILLTASSPTGLDRAAGLVDEIRLLPFDCVGYFKRAFGGSDCTQLIFGETELWPGMIAFASVRVQRIVMVNATISDFTFPWYRRLRGLLAPTLQAIHAICVSQMRYRDRFLELGATQRAVVVTGNTKYDGTPVLKDQSACDLLRRNYFQTRRPLVVFGSVRPGEEGMLLEAVRKVRARYDFNLIFAPRHQEKFDYFAEYLQGSSIDFARKSQMTSAAECNTVLLDTLGDLTRTYAIADLAFIGGSLIEGIGGHNPIEAVLNGAAVMMGPHFENVAEPVEHLRGAGGIAIVRTAKEIEEVLEACALDALMLRQLREAAQSLLPSFQGAVSRVTTVVLGEVA